ncbi:MAG: putative quinol monooxygenase [Candidatus Hydrogenedentota bacterium]
MIHVIATIDLAPGTRDQFLDVFHSNIPNVLKEEGCLGYEPAIDIDTGLDAQGPLSEDQVVVIEKWESLNHLHAHLHAPHMEEYREAVKDYVTGATLRVLAPSTDTYHR